MILKIWTGPLVQTHEFLVIQGLQEEVILGMHFLQKHDLTYDLVTRT
jgi:hypothetical protein